MKSRLFYITLFLFLAASTANALVLKKITLKDLVSRSDLIVIGTVASMESKFLEQKTYTFIKVDIQQVIKGDKTLQQVIVRKLGGRIGDRFSMIPGDATYETGEKVLLFLFKQGNYYFVRGMTQGKFKVIKKQGRDHVSQDLSKVMIVNPPGQPAPLEQKTVKPLSQFLKEIQGEQK